MACPQETQTATMRPNGDTLRSLRRQTRLCRALPLLAVALAAYAAAADDSRPFLEHSAFVVPKSQAAQVMTVSAASFAQGPLAKNSIVSSFGTGLTTGQTATAGELPLPVQLAGTTVQLFDSTGREGFMSLFFASPGQINWLLPDWPSAGPARIVVRRSDVREFEGTIEIVDVAPGLFFLPSGGRDLAAANLIEVAPDGSQTTVATFTCPSSGCRTAPIDLADRQQRHVVALFGTGIRAHSTISATIGGEDLPVLGVAAQGQFEGLDQVNVELRGDRIRDGIHQVKITADGLDSNSVILETVGGLPPPPAVLDSLSQSELRQGSQIRDFRVRGMGMAAVTEVRFSPSEGVTVSNLRSTESEVLLDIGVAENAPLGPRSFSLVSPGGVSNSLVLEVVEPPPGPTISNVRMTSFSIIVSRNGTITVRGIEFDFTDDDGDIINPAEDFSASPRNGVANLEIRVEDNGKSCFAWNGTAPFLHRPGAQSGSVDDLMPILNTARGFASPGGVAFVTLIDAAGKRSEPFAIENSTLGCR